MNDKENKEYIICPCCKAKVLLNKFCPECGTLLYKPSETISDKEQKTEDCSSPNQNVFIPLETDGEIKIIDLNDNYEEHQAVDDAGLTLLGEFSKKTMATVGGDGYDDIVLYKDETDGSFQIHTYSKYAFMQKEIHHSFKAKTGAYDALIKLVEKLHLDEYEGKCGVGLCGGMYVCKYRKDGVVHGVTTDNCGTDGPTIIIQVGNLLSDYKGEEITR